MGFDKCVINVSFIMLPVEKCTIYIIFFASAIAYVIKGNNAIGYRDASSFATRRERTEKKKERQTNRRRKRPLLHARKA